MGRKNRTKKTRASDQLGYTDGQDEDGTLPYICKTSQVYGRFLEARHDLKQGSLILSEKFIVAGPMRSSSVVCVGCHGKVLTMQTRKLSCPSCSWPICSSKCSTSTFHQEECAFFQQNNIQAPNLEMAEGHFGALTVLRALLLKSRNPVLWEALLKLEHHNDARKLTSLWKENEETVLNVLKNEWKLNNLFSDLEIHTVCGILEVNSFEIGEQSSFRAIFPTAAMMAHNCVPNVTHFENSEEGVIEVRATVDIPAGTPLYFSYAYALQGTQLRRKALQETKFFECSCSRCNDPTELGTHMSSLICQKCKIGFTGINSKTVENQATASWICTNSKCKAVMSGKSVDKLLDEFETESMSLVDISAKEKFLQKCLQNFCPNHYIPLGIKYALCQSYGREIPLQELSETDLERKAKLCSEVMKILDTITPGMTLIRGIILHEYQASEVTLIRRIYETRKYSKPLLKRRLESAKKLLEETVSILELCHTSTQEFRISQISRLETLPALQQWIQSLRSSKNKDYEYSSCEKPNQYTKLSLQTN